eukprot:GILI01041331.1.p1 GENE.GILI01041331.1~~GILI01041331.1.p1  ORF type:complete len:121 (+),score=4.68 GILI01041331.1:121-483(+)
MCSRLVDYFASLRHILHTIIIFFLPKSLVVFLPLLVGIFLKDSVVIIAVCSCVPLIIVAVLIPSLLHMYSTHKCQRLLGVYPSTPYMPDWGERILPRILIAFFSVSCCAVLSLCVYFFFT